MHHFCQHQVLEERITTKRHQGDEPHVAIKLPPFELHEEMKRIIREDLPSERVKHPNTSLDELALGPLKRKILPSN
jgi:hypothetical protein